MTKMGASCLLAAKWTLFTVALFLFLFRDGNCENMDHYYRPMRATKICGKQLTEVVFSFCANYFSPPKTKRGTMHPKMRAMYPSMNDFEDYENNEENNMMEFKPEKSVKDPNIDYQTAFLKQMYGNVWQNKKRSKYSRLSLVAECCLKSCTNNELQGYCNGQGGLRTFNEDE